MIPHFMEEDYYGGVEAACTILMKLASGEISQLREGDEGNEALIAFSVVILVIVLLVFIMAADQNNGSNKGNGGRRTYTGPIITSGNNYGGWGSSRGGSFGGGFGGFGGGSFGGGGAGGKW